MGLSISPIRWVKVISSGETGKLISMSTHDPTRYLSGSRVVGKDVEFRVDINGDVRVFYPGELEILI